MIVFKKIRWKNFLSTGAHFTEIDLSSHSAVLIVGENGAGKSTILDALSFALYGKPFRNINKGQLVNAINRKNAEVQVEFSIGKKNYLIKRGIKPNIFEVLVDGQLLNQDADSKEYQEMLEKQILKLNHKSFNQIVILGSASFTPFMQLSAANRREIIEDLLDIEIFSKMNVLLKDKIATNKTNITDVGYSINLTEEKIKIHKEHLESLRINNADLVNQKQIKVNDYITKCSHTAEVVNSLNTQKQSLLDLIVDKNKIQKSIKKQEQLKHDLTSKKNKHEHDVNFFESNDNCPTCRQQIAQEHKDVITRKGKDTVVTVAAAIIELNARIDQLKQRESEIEQIEEQISEIDQKISNHNVEVSTWKQFIQSLEKEIEQLQTDNTAEENQTNNLSALQKELEEHQLEKEKLVQQKAVLDVAALLLKDTGIKTKIIKQYVPIMNKLINKYLAAMDFFVNFELNENFEEVIKSRFRDEFTYASFSEGEKMRIDLALLFTWRAIAKLRNSASTNLLIMDEVFDSSLDNNGTEEFMKILNQLTKDNNTFIISHKGDQLFDKFVNVIKFEKVKNFSRISK